MLYATGTSGKANSHKMLAANGPKCGGWVLYQCARLPGGCADYTYHKESHPYKSENKGGHVYL